MTRGKTGLFAVLTALHPLTDLVSAALFMYAAEDEWSAVLYNGVAFALQLPFGCLLDRCRIPLRGLLAASWGLLVGGTGIYACFQESVPAIAVTCLGNAVFHIAAGRHILAEDNGRSSRVSLFVSTGAAGLLFGMRFGAEYPWTTIAAPLFLVAVLIAAIWRSSGGCMSGAPVVAAGRRVWYEKAMLVVLGALVVWRSYGVLTATRLFSSVHSGVALVAALAGCSWMGQAIGGYVSDRFGRLWLMLFSLTGCAVLCWLCPVDWTGGYLLLMFVAQLATGPVMSYLYAASASRAGLAFGVNCMALFVSMLLSKCPRGFFWFLAGEWLTLALEYAATAWIRLPRWFWALMTVNLTTHPALMYAVHRAGLSCQVVVFGELSAVLAEGAMLSIMYRRACSWWKMFAVSAWMNAVSYYTCELLKMY